MSSPLLITLFGPAGSGKGTIGKRLAEHFGCEHVDMGDLRREMARSYGVTLEELHQLGLHDRKYDDIQDDRVRKLPEEHDRLLIVSRTAWFLLPESIKVLLTCRPEIGAQRVAQRQGISAEEALERNAERDRIDGERYRRYVGIPEYPPKSDIFDVVVDSSDLSPDDVLNELIGKTEMAIGHRA
jgi:CMP/dCMP kinase